MERGWRDVTEKVTKPFILLFKAWEREFPGWFPDFPGCLFCLHYLFLPLINARLATFIRTWNNHRLSSEYGRTPNQLYRIFRHLDGGYPVDVDEYYGVEGVIDELQDEDADEQQQVVLEPLFNPLSDNQMIYFKEHVVHLVNGDIEQQMLNKLVHAINIFYWVKQNFD
jgi:hypothetical protein